MKPAVAIHDLNVAYRRHPALHCISGSFARGSLTAVVGPNGAGKSTLLKSLLGLVPVDSGQVTLHVARKRIAYLPQQAEIDRSFPISVLDCICLGYWQRLGIFGGVSLALIERATDALLAVGLQGFAQRSVGSLSAGQMQRVLFARILVQDADLILLDEPFNAVDAKTTEDLLAIVHAWHAQQRTVIAVLHDHEQVRCHFPQAVLLARRLVAWGDTAQVLSESHLHLAKHMPDTNTAEAAA
ncbi:ABC transporter family protein [Collimonas fungivorans]|jgi:zinc/manganese transport system ATP-binding protein|uniref:ABC transporter family protein n=1 Tax=Collimonas fungivorans TaxID=158899 RepID=A0A127P8H6_9BURK|nr:ABC transporter ATP-binding protein [Collimonas fungivorans]AMO94106.1 ABC transporter family protein [Collimonas fungivorans]